MDRVRKLLSIVIPVAIAAILVNDGGRYFTATYNLGNVTRDAAAASATAAHGSQDRTASWQAGQTPAQASGATVYGFDIKGGQVFVWTRAQVEGTWLLQPLMAYFDHKPQGTPLSIEDQGQALIQ
jgi:hypothetical protein